MPSEREEFSLSGPLHLTSVDWTNAHHQRSVAACMVQGVYIQERDRRLKRQGPEALAPPWWEFFHFKLFRQLVDKSSIFGAIYEYKLPSSHSRGSTDASPRFIIAFRGTLIEPGSLARDLELDLRIIGNKLHETSRFVIAIKAVRDVVASVGESNVWLAGHSLGAAVTMLAGKTMAKSGTFIQAFLFNSPCISAPIGKTLMGVIKAGLDCAVNAKKNHQTSTHSDTFSALSAWIPCLFVNRADWFCSGYVEYFEHRKKMADIGLGVLGRWATKHSLRDILMRAMDMESEPIHLIPSAHLTFNIAPAQNLKEDHGIQQWWKPDLNVQSSPSFTSTNSLGLTTDYLVRTL